jgi:hypothetical protein
MTSKDVSRIQSDLDEMEKGLGEFFLGACKIHGEGTYKMARNQKRIIGILKKIMKKEAYEARDLQLFVGG